MDRWADWLVRGRERGITAGQRRRMVASLRRLRDRVLRGAALKPGERVLDVGAGTGLIALAARRRVGPEGRVVALDLSADALREARREASDAGDQPPLALVRGDALHLPLADGVFDAVFTRSVLIYVADKPGAIRELHRVLRPGGRASIFEPINDVSRNVDWSGGRAMDALQPAHDSIVAYLQRVSKDTATMLGFDERDLLRWFVEAGFTGVRLTYELTYNHGLPERVSPQAIAAGLRQRPNPGTPSYEEGAWAVLGAAAEQHLERYVELVRSQPGTHAGAAAYIIARR